MKTAWKIAWVVHRHFFAIAFQMVTEVSGGARNNFSSNLQRQKLATGININAFFFWFQKVTTNYLHKALTKKIRTECLLEWWQNGRWLHISSPYQLADAKKTKYLPAIVSASQQTFSTKGHYYLLCTAKLKQTNESGAMTKLFKFSGKK